jgi:hypothetical protein
MAPAETISCPPETDYSAGKVLIKLVIAFTGAIVGSILFLVLAYLVSVFSLSARLIYRYIKGMVSLMIFNREKYRMELQTRKEKNKRVRERKQMRARAVLELKHAVKEPRWTKEEFRSKPKQVS